MKILFSLLLIICLGCSSANKHIAQDDNFSCGPVAIYNALVDEGKYKSVEELRTLANTITDKGTLIPDFMQAAEHLGFKIKLVNPTDLDYNKKYFIAMTVHKDRNLKKEGGHYVYVANGNAYNLMRNVPKTPLNYIVVQGILYKGENDYFPLVWEIE
jgi:ABC-type bacteriocin/lantibiotic exporter with double-glycine peptidase domain